MFTNRGLTVSNNPCLAHLRLINETDLVVKKINTIFVKHGWVLPQQLLLQIFVDLLEKILTECHNRHPTSTQLKEITNLKKKLKATHTVIRKTDKSKVFHLGRAEDYKVNIQAYKVLGIINTLETLVKDTNNFLYGLWRNKHISQRQYKKLKVNKKETELVHLYFLHKAHDPQTSLRLIMSGLKSPTIRISKWLDGSLRPLFDRSACDITIGNGVQLIRQVERWSANNPTSARSFIMMDVTDLFSFLQKRVLQT